MRSLASIDVRTPASFDQYAYMFVDPQLSLVVQGTDAELVVSANLPEALPEPSSALLAGAAAFAIFARARLGRPRAA